MSGYEQLHEELIQKSASREGTAILFSGRKSNGVDNEQLAKQCEEDNPNTYTITKTQAGQYLDTVGREALRTGGITPGQYQDLWNTASQMMAQQAKGDVIAFVDGEMRTASTFVNYELPTILGNNPDVPSINGVSVDKISNAARGNPVENYSNLTKLLGPKAECPDDNNLHPPTGGVAVSTHAQHTTQAPAAADTADEQSLFTKQNLAIAGGTVLLGAAFASGVGEVGLIGAGLRAGVRYVPRALAGAGLMGASEAAHGADGQHGPAVDQIHIPGKAEWAAPSPTAAQEHHHEPTASSGYEALGEMQSQRFPTKTAGGRPGATRVY